MELRQIRHTANDQGDAQRLRLIQLSDFHYIGDDQLHGGRSMSETFAQIYEYLRRPEFDPDVIVVTGDLIHRDSAGNYEDLQEQFERLRTNLQVPVVVTFGNHDDTARATEIFPLAQNIHLKTHRVITFDNSSPELTEDQITWLSEQLQEPYREGTILAFHHSPLPSAVPGLSARGMENRSPLSELIRGTDVVHLITGHYHHVIAGVFDGIPCWTSPAIATHQLMNAPEGQVGLVKQSGFSVHEYGQYGPLSTTIWLDTFPEVMRKQLD